MRNRLSRVLSDDDVPDGNAAGSSVRLVVIFAVIAAALLTIGGRVLWLQTFGRERYLAHWVDVEWRTRPLAARDGRVLTSDGLVLACDETRFAIRVHYRWLEEPADPAWLNAQALARLKPQARRNPQLLAAAREEVLSSRRQMHLELANLLELAPGELRERFQAIQTRVERIVAAVEARRAASAAPGSGSPLADEDREDSPTSRTQIESSGWQGLWQAVRRELTTPPTRPVRDPIIVAEELDYHTLVESASLTVVGRIQSFPSKFPGVDLQLTTQRSYPQGRLASHLVGGRTPLRVEEIAARKSAFPDGDPLGYQPGDRVGRMGIERSYDRILHGTRGEQQTLVTRQGEILRSEVRTAPVHGGDVVLSIDGRLQTKAEQLLDAVVERGELPPRRFPTTIADGSTSDAEPPTGGCLIAIDVRTGRVLAAAAAPRHDARLMASSTQAEWEATATDPRRPFFPRVSQATLPPGSVFKVLTAIAGIESGLLDPLERFDCRGYLHQPDRDRCYIFRHFGIGHGPVRLEQALSQSCNVYFFDLAERLGPEEMAVWATRFGLGTATGCDLPQERSGEVPTPRNPRAQRWYPGTTRQLAVGQGALTVTPLQVARMVAAIANDGWLVTPRFVLERDPRPRTPTELTASSLELVSHWSEVNSSASPGPSPIPGLSPGTLAQIRQGMRLAVEDERGTGREARVTGLSVAGKTGTAETGGGRADHAWFAGFAPCESPRVAVVVVLEHGGSGGQVAAPLARELLEEAQRLGHLPRSTPNPLTKASVPAP